MDGGHTDGTDTIKHPISWAGETIWLQDVDHPLSHHDLAEGRLTRTMAGWNFEVVPQLRVLHEPETDVDRFHRVGFEHLEYCQSLL